MYPIPGPGRGVPNPADGERFSIPGRGGGTSFQVQAGVSSPGLGKPHPVDGGYHIPGPGGGTPWPGLDGVPPSQDWMGYPPGQDCMGYTPWPGLDGVPHLSHPIRLSSIESTCYVAGGMRSRRRTFLLCCWFR